MIVCFCEKQVRFQGCRLALTLRSLLRDFLLLLLLPLLVQFELLFVFLAHFLPIVINH